MKSLKKGTIEYRIDVRESNLQVTRARMMVRELGGKFEEIEYDAITGEQARHLQILVKAAAELAKTATPRSDKTQILQRVNAAARRHSPTKRSLPKAGISEISPIAKETPRRRRHRR